MMFISYPRIEESILCKYTKNEFNVLSVQKLPGEKSQAK